MRRMSFAMTTDAVRARRKTVTRRLGWTDAKPGVRVLAVDKLRTKNAEALAVIEFVSVRREALYDINEADVRLEGVDTFDYCDAHHADDDLPPTSDCVDCFIEFFMQQFSKKKRVEFGALGAQVTRIEFRYLGEPHCEYCSGKGIRFWHTARCFNDNCVLAGGYDDCAGQLEPCPCIDAQKAVA